MKKIVGYLVFLVLVNNVYGQLNASLKKDYQRKGHLTKSLFYLKSNQQRNYVFVIAHRGDWRNAPENSLEAIKLCVDKGVDIVEVDVSETKDGELVVFHDKKLDRTTSGKGRLKSTTLKELKTLVLRDGLGRKTRHKIPTLKEVLWYAKGKILLDLDIKTNVSFEKVAKLLKETNTAQQVIIRSYRPLKEAQNYYGNSLVDVNYIPGIRKGTLSVKSFIAAFEKVINPVAFSVKFPVFTSREKAIFKELIKRKNRLWVHAITASRSGGHDDEKALINPDEAWGWLIAQGVSMIQTDRPELLLNYLRRKKLHE